MAQFEKNVLVTSESGGTIVETIVLLVMMIALAAVGVSSLSATTKELLGFSHASSQVAVVAGGSGNPETKCPIIRSKLQAELTRKDLTP